MVLCAPLLCWIGLSTVWGHQVNHPTHFSAFTTNHKIRWNQENSKFKRHSCAGALAARPGISRSLLGALGRRFLAPAYHF